MALWGAVAAALGAVQTTKQLIGMRFLLGVFEAGFSVSCIPANHDTHLTDYS